LGERFDLGEALMAADALIAAATTFQGADTTGAADDPANVAHNRALLRAGRLLTALSYAQRGAFRQDAALDIPPIPDLAAAVRALDAAMPGSDTADLAGVSLLRARNRASWTLREAARELR